MLDSVFNQQSSLSFLPAAPLPVQQPTLHLFADAKDAKLGWLTWDFPAPFFGCGSGNPYIHPLHYCTEKMAFFSGQEELRKKILAVKANTAGADGEFDQASYDQATAQLNALIAENSSRLNWTAIAEKLQHALIMAISYKFCQNKSLFDLLLATGNDILVEATDNRLTGIGFTEAQVRAGQAPLEYWGSNLHGVTLMKIRDELRGLGWDNRPKTFYVPPVSKGADSFPRPEPTQPLPPFGFPSAPALPGLVETLVTLPSEPVAPAAVVEPVPGEEVREVEIPAVVVSEEPAVTVVPETPVIEAEVPVVVAEQVQEVAMETVLEVPAVVTPEETA